MCMYHISWPPDCGFCCELDDDCVKELVGVPGVISVTPDENVYSDYKDYGGILKETSRRNFPIKWIYSTSTMEDTTAQYHDWIRLLEVISKYKTYVEVSHLRHTVSVTEGPILWWSYAAQAALQQKKMWQTVASM
ncbi:putative vacuolar protein sorting-associated protein 13, second [Helianthus annuus]|nr:putative vacuolar protein sorting-associated protein 13, second [Helianthus annuus]